VATTNCALLITAVNRLLLLPLLLNDAAIPTRWAAEVRGSPTLRSANRSATFHVKHQPPISRYRDWQESWGNWP